MIFGRFIFYGLKAYTDYLSSKIDFYDKKRLILPQLTVFCIYTGKKKLEREYNLTDEFYSLKLPYNSLQVTVYIIDKNNCKDEILNQYIEFSEGVTKLWREGKTSSADVAEFLNECIKNNILREFIEKNKTEVPEMINNDFSKRENLIYEDGKEDGSKEMKDHILKLMKENPNLFSPESLAFIENSD